MYLLKKKKYFLSKILIPNLNKIIGLCIITFIKKQQTSVPNLLYCLNKDNWPPSEKVSPPPPIYIQKKQPPPNYKIKKTNQTSVVFEYIKIHA